MVLYVRQVMVKKYFHEVIEEEEKKAKKKTYDLEIFNGPFKGFHGNVVERLEDGVVRAEVVIFGKTNTVTLESSEYRETSKPPSK